MVGHKGWTLTFKMKDRTTTCECECGYSLGKYISEERIKRAYRVHIKKIKEEEGRW